MKFRLLIDECLHHNLARLSVEAGYVESTCARDRGLLGVKDWELMRVVVDEDYTLVTHNAQDFRGEGKDNPGGHFAARDIHAGLVCLNSELTMTPARQQSLFAVALQHLEEIDDLINQALEVFEDANGIVTVDVYDIPRE